MAQSALLVSVLLAHAQAPATQDAAPAATPPAAQAAAAPEVVVLAGGTVHTMIAGEAPRVANVVLEGSRIRSIDAADAAPPAGARRVDVSGKHVLPGLVDGFVHHDPDHDRLYTTAGVTLVRDTGNELAKILAERDKSGKGGLRERGPGPAIWCAGAVLDGARPSTTAAVVLASPEEVEAKLPRFIELQPDFLSFHSGLTPPVWRKVIEIGHARGLQVWGPAFAGADPAQVAAAGQDGLYHLEAFLPRGKSWAEVTLDELRPAAAALAGKKLAVTPTLAVFARRLITPPETPPELAYLGPAYVSSWLAEGALRTSLLKDDAAYLKNGLRAVEVQGQLVKLLHETGVTIVPGSGSPNPWLFPGDALLDELSLLARAGIPKDKVLALATAGAAQAIGAASERGTVEAGKIADLIVVDSDPREDLARLHAPSFVVLRGRVLDRAALDALKKDLSETQKKLQADAFQPPKVSDPPIPEGDVLLRGTVETRGLGQRISSENFAVVRGKDGSVAYSGRVVTPATASGPPTETQVQQTIRDGAVASFEVLIRSGERRIEVRGFSVGNDLKVERRIDGGFFGNVPVRERIAFVDAGSVTSAIALGQREGEGTFKVLFFEDLDPATGSWELRVEPDGTRVVRTQNGALKVKYSEDGSVADAVREEGSGVIATRPLSTQALRGGLPPAAAPRDARDAAKNAAAPAKKD